MTNFFSLTKVLFGRLIFFPEVMLEIGGAAYTRVFTVFAFALAMGLNANYMPW